MTSDKILVFIPMYNCEKQIAWVIAQFDPETQRLFAEIIAVDNGSKDNTVAVASEAIRSLQFVDAKVVKNRANYGLGGSHKVAFNHAIENGFDYVVVLHGDDQGSISDLVPLLRQGVHREYDSMLGSRFMPGSHLSGYSSFRVFGNKVFNLLVSAAMGRKVTDMGSGLNLYRMAYLKDKAYLKIQNNLTFNNYMVFYGQWVKSRFTFFPIRWREDDQISNAKLFRQATEILSIVVRYVFARGSLFDDAENEFSRINYGFDVVARNAPRKEPGRMPA